MKLMRALACLTVATACLSAPALAALGGDASSVEADRARLKGALRVTSQDGYSVHEIQTAAGLVVHEYVTPNDKVFAVSWRGPGIPDLRQVLGSYYNEFEQAAAATPSRNHHHLTVQTPQVVVQSSGRTRAYFGRAWAPALLPQNFSVTEIN